jgi:hypothetical protein
MRERLVALALPGYDAEVGALSGDCRTRVTGPFAC